MSRTNDERFEDEPPTLPRASHAPVVCPPRTARAYYSTEPLPGPAPRKPTTPGLGAVSDPFPLEEAPTPTVASPEAQLARDAAKLVRNWRACPPDRRRQLSRMALQYREDAEGLDRKT